MGRVAVSATVVVGPVFAFEVEFIVKTQFRSQRDCLAPAVAQGWKRINAVDFNTQFFNRLSRDRTGQRRFSRRNGDCQPPAACRELGLAGVACFFVWMFVRECVVAYVRSAGWGPSLVREPVSMVYYRRYLSRSFPMFFCGRSSC